MDDIARYNQQRWRALSEAKAVFTRPQTDLDSQQAHEYLDPHGHYGDLHEKEVLCLAGGGGQQSVAFGLLGARVTVVDLSEEQLERDRQMAQHYGLTIKIHQGDMRDLNRLSAQHFDLVYQPYSINFVPDATVVFEQVARVIKPHGMYDLMCANPFAAGVKERDWNGTGYTVQRAYEQGQPITYPDQEWVYDRDSGIQVPPPIEYRHTLSTVMNGLIRSGFVLAHLEEIAAYEVSIEATPGTWDHFTAVLPPWLRIWSRFHPE
jgi:SAM-dependent methyltransferase